MRILIVLTYFQPYKSGLTIYAVHQAQALAALGHDVTVLTSQYDPDLPLDEWDEGVHIVRLPVALRFSKGVIMPKMPFKSWQLIRESDAVNLHLPQADAALVALLAKLQGKPVVSTYHCDITMPPGWVNQLAGWGVSAANHMAASLSDIIVHNTRDFAENSNFLHRYLDKLEVLPTPVVVEKVTAQAVQAFREKYHITSDDHVVGMVARLASEKGVEYLVEAMPKVTEADPKARVVFVGEYQHVLGEDAYREKIMPMIESLGDRWTFLGVLSEAEKAAFFNVCDVLVLPSINSTESFGMVQIEGMTCGTPVVATNLPGVRQPVISTGMGKIVPVKDENALASAIIQVLRSGATAAPGVIDRLKRQYSPESVAKAYETLFKELIEPDG